MKRQPDGVHARLTDIMNIGLCDIAVLKLLPEMVRLFGTYQFFERLVYQTERTYVIKEKHISFGVHPVAKIDALNEERFAMAFAGGKFRVKQWGRVKIKYELKQKQVSEYCIKKGMNVIDDADYMQTIQKLFELKSKELKHEKNQFIKKKKIQDYLLQKGYESEVIRNLLSTNKNEQE